MPYQSPKEEAIEQSSHTSHEESGGAVGGTRDGNTKATKGMKGQTRSEEEKTRNDEHGTTLEVAPAYTTKPPTQKPSVKSAKPRMKKAKAQRIKYATS